MLKDEVFKFSISVFFRASIQMRKAGSRQGSMIDCVLSKSYFKRLCIFVEIEQEPIEEKEESKNP